MTRDEKAKAYDEALEKIREGFKPLEDGSKITGVTRAFLEEVFPELAESEDERIRKELIAFIKKRDRSGCDYDYDKWIAWLEKQGEKFTIYDVETYNSANQKAWNNYEQFQNKVSPLTSKEIYDNGFHDGYQFGIHEEKPYKWTKHDEAVRKEAISCLKSWKNIIPVEFNEDYKNILIWLENELSIHTEKQGEKKSKWSEEDERIRKALVCHISKISTEIPVGALHRINGVDIPDILAWLEKQREQKEYTFKSLPRLLDMIEPTSKAKAYCQKLIDILVKEGYSTDAKIVGEYLKQMNGEKVAMATMDEQKEHLWKDAEGDILPEIDREVIVLCECHGGYKVCYAHRPDPDGWDGVNILAEETEHYGVKTYGKRGWSIPDVKWWLDLTLPYEGKEDEK